ncbi:uncharacterized protein LOC121996268 [Zingiber officinale]|uniref:Uncharacterized protein n=1 Tax=Zingiber officinale TaxID=94328 RepID=A0A8J5G0R7_ZINOF|nr:uncharacterized protein LOC121996268 [Zingiber officinale]KAG6499385.1 hypothetical protein ZIOFF_039158 [Zingiber officinale]
MCFRKTSWISVICHLLTLGLACFLFLLHKFLPSLFSLVLNCVPVIVCTILLLGILLSYSELNIPGHDQDGICAAAETSVKLSLVANGLGTKSDRKFKGKAHGGSRKETRRTGVRTIVLGNERQHNADGKEVEQCKVDQIDAAATSVSSSCCGEEEDPVSKRNSVTGDEDSVEKKQVEDETKVESGYDSCVGSPSCHLDRKGVSLEESESDEALSSDNSAATGLPLLDELDPLVSGKNSDGGSTVFSGDHETEDGSVEEEAENQDDEDDDEAQEEEEEEEKGGNPVAVTWTADDQRSLVELGNSELERNQRLENLLEKRKARKILEKNLIDLDDDMEERLQAHGRLLSINAARRNPFDIPELDEVPGSAPSMPLLRQNPFDIPFEPAVGEDNSNQKEFVAVPPRDSFFRRHESFSVGSIFEFRQPMAFKPYFGAEKIGSEKKDYEGPSKLNSMQQFNSVSSVANQDNATPVKHDPATTEKASQTMNKDHAVPSNGAVVTTEHTDRDTEMEGDTSEASVLNSPTSYSERVGMVDEDNESNSFNTSDAEKQETDPMDGASGSNFMEVEANRNHENHVEPVYDSSPTATERSHSNLALDEAFHNSDKGGSPPRETDETDASSITTRTEESAQEPEHEIPWVAPTSLAYVDQNESVSKEVSMINERDVIGDELTRVHDDFDGPALTPLPDQAEMERMLHSNSSAAVENEAKEEKIAESDL